MPIWDDRKTLWFLLLYLVGWLFAWTSSPGNGAWLLGVWLVGQEAAASGARRRGVWWLIAAGAFGIAVWADWRPSTVLWPVYGGVAALAIWVAVAAMIAETRTLPQRRAGQPRYAAEAAVMTCFLLLFFSVKVWMPRPEFVLGLIVHSGIVGVLLVRHSRFVMRPSAIRSKEGEGAAADDVQITNARGLELLRLTLSLPSGQLGLAFLVIDIAAIIAQVVWSPFYSFATIG